MSNTIVWNYDPAVTITSFALEKSVDKGLTFAALATVVFNLTGANYDQVNKRFFYLDGAGNPGDVYRVTSTGAFGVSGPTIAVAPPAQPALCTVIGYVLDGLGRPRTDVRVEVHAYGVGGERWTRNHAGVVAQNPAAVGIVATAETVYPDAAGVWQVSLLQKALVRIEIAELGLSWAFEVPAKVGPVNVRDLPQLRGASFNGIWDADDGSPAVIV